jgi:assimilatory nitrate reductase catalytic subunit
MHWTSEYAANARVDALVAPITDPVSGQPALKHVGVAAAPAAIGAYGFAVLAERPDRLDLPYWAIAKAEGGWRLELGFFQEPDDLAQWCRDIFGLPENAVPLIYADNAACQTRIAFFDGDRLVCALFLAGEPVAVSRNWAIQMLSKSHADIRAKLAIVAGRPGADQPDPGATVCSCFSVGVNQITAAVLNGCSTVESIGTALRAGTNCGSCRAEIRGIIDGRHRQAAE